MYLNAGKRRLECNFTTDLTRASKYLENLEEKEIPPLEQRLESVTDREDTLGVVMQSIKDEVPNPGIFPDQIEALERSIYRKMTKLHDFLGVDLLIQMPGSKMCTRQTHAQT